MDALEALLFGSGEHSFRRPLMSQNLLFDAAVAISGPARMRKIAKTPCAHCHGEMGMLSFFHPGACLFSTRWWWDHLQSQGELSPFQDARLAHPAVLTNTNRARKQRSMVDFVRCEDKNGCAFRPQVLRMMYSCMPGKPYDW